MGKSWRKRLGRRWRKQVIIIAREILRSRRASPLLLTRISCFSLPFCSPLLSYEIFIQGTIVQFPSLPLPITTVSGSHIWIWILHCIIIVYFLHGLTDHCNYNYFLLFYLNFCKYQEMNWMEVTYEKRNKFSLIFLSE